MISHWRGLATWVNLARRVTTLVCTLSACILLTHCASAPQETDGRWITSWYGEPFHGRRTASGEIYNMNHFTAAHRTLPFGTRLRVTNPANGISTTVTINDRGPFIRGRDLDLSHAAAQHLGIIRQGVAPVDVIVLPRGSLTP
ncbi:MAG: septal ring lytic transglycosylase RlpA family protein [Candidatus Methylacidiphilales bacterium]